MLIEVLSKYKYFVNLRKMAHSAKNISKDYLHYCNIIVFWPLLTSWFFSPPTLRGCLICFTPNHMVHDFLQLQAFTLFHSLYSGSHPLLEIYLWLLSDAKYCLLVLVLLTWQCLEVLKVALSVTTILLDFRPCVVVRVVTGGATLGWVILAIQAVFLALSNLIIDGDLCMVLLHVEGIPASDLDFWVHFLNQAFSS